MPSWKQRLAVVALSTLTALAGLGALAPDAVAATPLDGFDPGMIVSDHAFYEPGRMTRAQVAAFIAEQGQGCTTATGTPCLKDFVVDTPATTADPYCAALPAVRGNTAAGIVNDVAGACGINPQMLLVLIQKESSLLTARGSALTPTAYARATGAGCPDYLGCDSTTASFFGQVHYAAKRFRTYAQNPGNYLYKVGPNKIQYNPETTCGTADVTIRNQATAGLYIYTPYVPNAAALTNWWGEGDRCSSYGNRNFYYWLKRWFPAATTGSTAAPIAPTPPSTVTPALTAIYDRSAELTLRRTGAATASASGCSARPWSAA